MRSLLISFGIILVVFQVGKTQVSSDPESSEDTLSNLVMNADTAYHVSLDTLEIDTLTGNVIMTQDSLVMFCNRAIVKNEIHARAYEDVIIIHHDTIQIYADSMRYNGATKIAELFGEVILQDGGRRLYTSKLLYDVGNKYAEYLNGGTIIEALDTIVSKEGYYYQAKKKVRLIGNVSFVDTTKQLLTDSIIYLYDLDQLNIIAPTQINQDSVDIYCESGIYRLESDRGVLSSNVQVISGDQYITSEVLDIKGQEDTYTFLINPKIVDKDAIAEGDSIIYYDKEDYIEIRTNAYYESKDEIIKAPIIIYDQKSESYQTKGRSTVTTNSNVIKANEISSGDQNRTILKGDVNIYDEESQIRILSSSALKDSSITKMFSERGQPLLTYEMTSDSLLLRADTLVSNKNFENTDSSQQIFTAINKVKLKNGNTFGASNHFLFRQEDSIIVLTNRPIIWSDSTQLTGDTIKIFLKNNDVYKISLINEAFIISPDSGGMYNQIKGLSIDNFLIDTKLNKSIVKGNAELFYMVKDDQSYKGVNLTKSDEMTFTFKEDDIEKVQMLGQPQSNMYEYIEGMDLNTFYLDGFDWRISERPHPKLFFSKKTN